MRASKTYQFSYRSICCRKFPTIPMRIELSIACSIETLLTRQLVLVCIIALRFSACGKVEVHDQDNIVNYFSSLRCFNIRMLRLM
jgi:hypothetical protein